MKKLVALFFTIAILILSVFPTAIAGYLSETDYNSALEILDKLDLKHLQQIREEIDRKILELSGNTEIKLQGGTYQVGTDIPVGHWTISAATVFSAPLIYYFEKADASGVNIDYAYKCYIQTIVSKDLYEEDQSLPYCIDINMQDGWYIQTDSAIILTPYSGKNTGF